MLVQRGTLRVGDAIVAGDAFGRVRAMLDEHGETVDEAGPSRPVQVLGLTSVPGAGDNFLVADEDRTARQIAEKRAGPERNASLAKARRRVTLEDWLEQSRRARSSTLNLILKGDVSGSVEALEDALLKIDVGEEVDICGSSTAVSVRSPRTTSTWPSASDAVIIGFNVRPPSGSRELAEREGVDVRYYSVIYQAIDEIEAALKGMLKPEYEEVQLGTAEIREVFRSSQVRQHRRCAGPLRRDPAQHQGPSRPRRRGRRGEPHHRVAAPLQGRRHRGPRGLRVRYRPRVVQRHQGRRRHRDVRDAREAARLTEAAAMMYVGIASASTAAARRRAVAEGEALGRPADRGRACAGSSPSAPPRPGTRTCTGGPLLGVAVVAPDAGHCTDVLDSCERLVAGHPEVELLSAAAAARREDD